MFDDLRDIPTALIDHLTVRDWFAGQALAGKRDPRSPDPVAGDRVVAPLVVRGRDLPPLNGSGDR